MKRHTIDQNLNFRNYMMLVVQGFCMGIANAIPGISGGTVAFIFGIYENLINAIKSVNLKVLKLIIRFNAKELSANVPWRFLVSLLSGAFLAIVIFSKAIGWMLVHKPVLINSFFFGLILATIPIMARIITKWNAVAFCFLIAGAVVTYQIGKMIPVETPEAAWFIFVCGVIAVSTMILPGISGAFVLVIMGKYEYIIQAVNDRNLIVLGIFLCGMIVGIVVFVRFLSWLFRKYHDVTIALLTGIVIGSLDKIWPWKETVEQFLKPNGKTIPIRQINFLPQTWNGEIGFALILMVIGFILAFLLNSSENKKILL